MPTSTPSYAEDEVEFAPASSSPLTYGNDEVEFAEPSSQSNLPSYSTSDVEFAPALPGSLSTPSSTPEQMATRKLVAAEFNRITRGPIDLTRSNDFGQPRPTPFLGPAPAAAPSVDDQEANRLIPNQARYVARQAVPEPQTLGDLTRNDNQPIATDVVPGAPVQLEQPATARQVADQTEVSAASALPAVDISPSGPGGMSRQFHTDPSGAVVDAGGEPIGKPIEDFGPEMRAASLQFRDGLMQLAPALANLSDAPGANPDLVASQLSSPDGRQGLTKLLNSSMQLSTPLLAYELTRNPAAANALLTGIFAGQITGAGARRISQLMGGDADAQAESETIGGMAGGIVAGGLAHGGGEGAKPEPGAASNAGTSFEQRLAAAKASWESTKPQREAQAAYFKAREDAFARGEEPPAPRTAGTPAPEVEGGNRPQLPAQASEEVQEVATHPAGKVTAIDQHTGLPIVDRTQPSETFAAKGEDLPPQTGEAGKMSPEAEATSAAAQAKADTGTDLAGRHVLLQDGRLGKVDTHDAATGDADVTIDGSGEKVRGLAGQSLTPVAEIASPEIRTSNPGERVIAQRTVANGPQLIAQYIKNNTKNGAVQVSTDLAKEQFPEFQADPVNNDTLVAGSASALSKAVLKTLLSRPPAEGTEGVRIQTASPGSGKTNSLHFPGDSNNGIDFESLLNSPRDAVGFVQSFLDSGRNPKAHWVYVDDFKKTVDRMIARAVGHPPGSGIGRTVDLKYMADTYRGMPARLRAIREKFGDRVPIRIIDNSDAPGEAKIYNGDAGELYHWVEEKSAADYLKEGEQRLEELRAAGKVPDDIYRQAIAYVGRQELPGVERNGRRGSGGGQPERTDTGAAQPAHGGAESSGAGSAAPVAAGATQEVGSTEPESGRVVTQPSDKLASAQELATKAAPELKQKLASITKEIPGAKVAVREAKNPERAWEKAAKEGQPVETISDLLAARISADSPAARERIAAGIKKNFTVLKDEDQFTRGDPNYGYHAHTLQVQMGNGSTAEVQIVPKEILGVEDQTHANYRAGREAEIAGRDEEAQAAMAKNLQIHDAAMGRFNARNGIYAKGDRVRLEDGAMGTVAYVDPRLRIVRVRTDDGRNITVANEKMEVVNDRNRNGRAAASSIRNSEPGNALQDARGATPPVGGRTKVEMVPTERLHLDPKRFQYKLNTNGEGVTDLLKGKRWNEDLAGVLGVWRDPANGKLYVVNGHHRADLAIKQNAAEHNVPEVAVKYIRAADAASARSVGALQNIAEGRGTALDAAKYFRDAGIGPEELGAKGISMRESTAENGLALSGLMPSLFDEVVSGKMTEARGISIGKAAPTPEQQEAIVKMIRSSENRGRTVTNATIEEFGRMARNAGVHRESTQTLFGTQERTRSLALEKAEISAYVRKKIADERKLFAHVADKGRAEALDKAGNKIATSRNARVAERAAEDERLYDRLAGRSGPIDDILERSAQQLAEKLDDAATKRNAYTQIRKSLDSLRGTEGERADGVQAYSGPDSGGEYGSGDGRELHPAGGIPQSRLRNGSPAPSLALPGFENSIEAQHEAAGTERGNQLTNELNRPKGDIERAAGEMEPKSPLFEGSEANPQNALFNRSPEGWDNAEAEASRDRKESENLARATHKVIPGSGTNHAVIELSHDGMSYLEHTALPGRARAVYLPKRYADDVSVGFRRAGKDAIADAMDANRTRTGGVILSRPGVGRLVLSEERWHAWQGEFADLHRAGIEAVMRRYPEELRKIGRDLAANSRFYAPDDWDEVFAKMASGSEKLAGQDKLLATYLDGILRNENGGRLAFRELPELSRDTIEAVRDANPDLNGVKFGGESGRREARPGAPDGQGKAVDRGGRQERGSEDRVRRGPALNFAGPVGRYLQEQADLVKVSREIHGGLQDLDPQYDADVLRAIDVMNKLPGTPADQEQAYHALENPAEPTTPVQRQIIHDLGPMRAESESLFRKLYPNRTISGDYVHRIAQQKGGLLDRILKGSQSTGRGDVLKKNAAAGQKRSMMALESPTDGSRQVVSVGRGRVTAWQNNVPSDIGSLRPGMTTADAELDRRLDPLEREGSKLRQEQRTLNATPSRQAAAKVRLNNIAQRLSEIDRDKTMIENQHLLSNLPQRMWKDKNGKLWQFKQATTKEIERETPIEYYKNAAASTVTNWLELRKAARAADYLDKLKTSPGFSSIAVKPSDPGQIPEGWQSTQLPQLIGYYFEPHVAEVFDRYAKELSAGDPSVFSKVNNFLTSSIFLNPVVHLPNLTLNWVAEKGLGILNPLEFGTEMRAGVKAFNAVIHQNGDFLAALDTGAPMHSQRLLVQQFAGELVKKLQAQATNPGVLAKLHEALGNAIDVPHMMKSLVDLLNVPTGLAHDMFILQSAYTKMDGRNMTLRQALADTANYIPNERLPTRILNSKTLGDVMNSPALMFTRWHYGLLKAWGNMLMKAAGANFDAAATNARGEVVNPAGRTKGSERARALNIAAGLAVLSAVVFPAIDKLLQKATGNEDARFRRAGLLSLSDNGVRAAKGDISPQQATRSVVTPSVGAETAADLALNRDLLGNQRKIYDEHGTGKEIVEQVGTRVAGAVSPAQLAMRAMESGESAKKALLAQVGVSFPQHGAVRLAAELRAEHFGDTAETPEERKRSVLTNQAHYLSWQGDFSGIAEAKKSGLFTPKQIADLYITSHQDPLVYEAKGFGIKDLLKLAEFRGTTAQERQKLRPLIIRRAGQIQQAPANERDGLRKRLHDVMAVTR